MLVEIRMLGGFSVHVDSRPVPEQAWRRRPAAALVKLLALQPARRLLREQLIDAMWPDVPVHVAAPRLHKAAHYARTALGVRDGVVLAGEQVQLLPFADVVVDVEVFDRAADAALFGDPDARLLEAAIAGYHGALLPEDLYEAWSDAHRESRRLRYLELLRAAGRWERLAELDPADEQAHLHLMRAAIARGDRRGALARFDRLAAALDEELGLAPSDAALSLREEAVALGADDVVLVPRPRAPVPLPATVTVGRDADIASINSLLDRARVVTLLGPGGVGKTRLAAEVALRREALGVEACFVDLTLVDRADDVLDLIMRELGLHEGQKPARDRRAQQALAGRWLLVVLDNFEHVIDAANVVGTLLRWSPYLRVLVTSRARLHVAGEHIHDVAPLPVLDRAAAAEVPAGREDAVTLFTQVARAADPNFDVARYLDDVAAICRSLDGLPLAIELAAGNVRTLTPPLLRTRLAVRLGSRTGVSRDLHPRQLTIPATIDWSLHLLRQEERRLFSRLGVFGSAVPVEAVEAVCGDDLADVVGHLTRLVDSSLVRRRVDSSSGEPRFGMLSLLRERARKLLADEPDGTPERHAHYYARLLDELEECRWSAVGRWVALVEDMHPEIRSAHAWAVANEEPELAGRITGALTLFWHRNGYHDEGRSWVASALALQGHLSEATLARVLVARGVLAWAKDPVAAREPFTAAAERFRALGDDRYLSYALALAAGTHIGVPDQYEHGLAQCDEAIALARRGGETHLLAIALNDKGELARVHGDDDLARELYEEGCAAAAAAGDEAHVSVFLANLSYLACHRGEYDEAQRLCREALEICWRLGRRLMTAWTLSQLAGPEVNLSQPERGAVLVGAADAALDLLDGGRFPGDVGEHDRVVAQLMAALGENGYAQWYAHGARLSLSDAVTMALSDGPPTLSPLPASLDNS